MGLRAKKFCYMLCLYWLLIIQIILESFPVGSSSHVIIFRSYFQKYGIGCTSPGDFFSMLGGSDVSVNTLFHFMHGPTIVVLIIFFASRWTLFIKRFRMLRSRLLTLLVCIFCADLCTVLFFLCTIMWPGLFTFPLGLGLCITAISLASVHFCPDFYTKKRLDMRSALIIGSAQGLALLPGISRLALTYCTARWLQFAPGTALEISCLMQWPLIVAGFVQSVNVLGLSFIQTHFLHLKLILFILGATIVALYGLQFVAYMMRTKREWWFSLYLCIPLVMWLYLVI